MTHDMNKKVSMDRISVMNYFLSNSLTLSIEIKCVFSPFLRAEEDCDLIFQLDDATEHFSRPLFMKF
jgi:hypothetical protein